MVGRRGRELVGKGQGINSGESAPNQDVNDSSLSAGVALIHVMYALLMRGDHVFTPLDRSPRAVTEDFATNSAFHGRTAQIATGVDKGGDQVEIGVCRPIIENGAPVGIDLRCKLIRPAV